MLVDLLAWEFLAIGGLLAFIVASVIWRWWVRWSTSLSWEGGVVTGGPRVRTVHPVQGPERAGGQIIVASTRAWKPSGNLSWLVQSLVASRHVACSIRHAQDLEIATGFSKENEDGALGSDGLIAMLRPLFLSTSKRFLDNVGATRHKKAIIIIDCIFSPYSKVEEMLAELGEKRRERGERTIAIILNGPGHVESPPCQDFVLVKGAGFPRRGHELLVTSKVLAWLDTD